MLKYKLNTIELTNIEEAIRFLEMNSFFTYILGPFINASPLRTDSIHKVNMNTNFWGDNTIENTKTAQKVMNTEAKQKHMAAFE